MKSKLRLFVLFLVIGALLAPRLRAQDDPDVTKMMKEAQEMQKQAEEMNKSNPPASKEKMAELQKQAREQVAQQEQEEKKEKEKLQAALKKQLEATEASLPAWTPATPQFTPAGPVTKRIEDGEVNIVQTGTSPLTPAQLGDAWEKGAGDKLNHSRSNNQFNDTRQVIIYLYTREGPRQEVRLEATREPKDKATQIKIQFALPKPEID